MKAQTFADMSEAEFDGLIERYIEREAHGYGEMPTDIFFDLLLTQKAAQSDETVNLEISLAPEGNNLTLIPDRELSDMVVQGNEILVGGHRLVFQLQNLLSLPNNLRDTAEQMAKITTSQGLRTMI